MSNVAEMTFKASSSVPAVEFRSLADTLGSLGIGRIGPIHKSPTPAGKGVSVDAESFVLAALVTRTTIPMLSSVLALWSMRARRGTVKIELDGNSIELTSASGEMQNRLISLLEHRLTDSTQGNGT